MDNVYHEQRVWIIASYILHLLGAVLGIPSIIGLVLNYVQRDTALPDLRTHHSWMIRTFWWALFWTIIAAITWFLVVGMLLAPLIWIWWMYRHIRGLIRLADRLPMPAGETA